MSLGTRMIPIPPPSQSTPPDLPRCSGWTASRIGSMSSYEYNSNYQGPPSAGDGRTNDTTCFGDRWRCEHRWRVIANMAAFHNNTRGTPVIDWWDNGNDAIAFGRGTPLRRRTPRTGRVA